MEIESKHKVFFLPFIYYYTLSIAVLLVGVYLLAKLPDTNSRLTFAQSENVVEESQIQIDLSSSTHEGTFVTELTVDENGRPCDLKIAKQIDTYFGNINAPLEGNGCDFVFHAKENGLNPYLVAAIGMCESTGGKVTPQFGGQESYNAWGWAVMDSNDTTKEVNGYGCSSWEECIGRVTRGIARKKDKGLDPVDIVKWYTPASVEKANGVAEESPWVKCVSSTISKIQAL